MTSKMLNKNIYYKTNEILPNRKTLVFVHGLSGSSSAWVDYEKKFGEKYNVVTYDLRGHGRSIRYKKYSDYDMNKFVEDLHDLILELKIQKFVLISHSFGTLIALDFILKYGNFVESAVFLSPNFKVKQKLLAGLLVPVVYIMSLMKLPIKNYGSQVDYTKFPNTGDWNIPRMIADVGNTGLSVYLYCTKQSCNFERLEDLKKIEIPVMIMHGSKDTIFPVKNSFEINKRIKGSELTVIENTDHIIVLNNFKEVSEKIEEFIQRSVK